MSLRYCLSCKKICDDSNILLAGKTYQCASCKNILIYFGREEASISVDSIIAKYDAFHPYKPREDFRGLSKKSFDGKGNFSLGIKEQIVFSEIDYDKLDSLRGMDITIVTTAKNDNEGLALLKKFNMPINT